MLRPADTAQTGGRFHVPPKFRVVLTTSFAEASYADFLRDALPLDRIQPIVIRDRAGAMSAPELPGTTPKSGQLTGDRTTLVLQGWGTKGAHEQD